MITAVIFWMLFGFFLLALWRALLIGTIVAAVVWGITCAMWEVRK